MSLRLKSSREKIAVMMTKQDLNKINITLQVNELSRSDKKNFTVRKQNILDTRQCRDGNLRVPVKRIHEEV